ncbi:MAG: hypothetical protein JSS79_01130 [Bacteroidetes bacterium]|nr:hypothetical protein [Bacteroidota bacterium]
MKNYCVIFFAFTLSACGGSKALPVNIMEQWVGQPIRKLDDDSDWSRKRVLPVETLPSGDKIYCYKDKGVIPELTSDIVKDSKTEVTYVGPAGTKGKYFILNRFRVRKDTIIGWEIVQRSTRFN